MPPSTKLESVFNQSLNRTTDGWALFSSTVKSIAQNKTMMYEQWIDEQALLTCRSKQIIMLTSVVVHLERHAYETFDYRYFPYVKRICFLASMLFM